MCSRLPTLGEPLKAQGSKTPGSSNSSTFLLLFYSKVRRRILTYEYDVSYDDNVALKGLHERSGGVDTRFSSFPTPAPPHDVNSELQNFTRYTLVCGGDDPRRRSD